jgi:hypothetical protein
MARIASVLSVECVDAAEGMRCRVGRVTTGPAPPVKYDAAPVVFPVRTTYFSFNTNAFHLMSRIF